MTMLRPLSTTLTLFAWCCLAVPWLVCNSDCRDGSVQLWIHDCHSVEHHSCGSAEPADACHADVEQDGDVCLQHEGETHRTLVFLQTSCDPIETPRLEMSVTGILDYPGVRGRMWANEREERIKSPVDPPWFENQGLVQLRTDVLLR